MEQCKHERTNDKQGMYLCKKCGISMENMESRTAEFPKEFYEKMISELEQLKKEMSIGASDLGGYKRTHLLGTIKILKEEIVWQSGESLSCEHDWLQSGYVMNTEYCTKCKISRKQTIVSNSDEFMEDESEYDPSIQASKNEERFKEINDGH